MTQHESYVSLEVAKLLKEAGFDWECIRYYQNDDETLYGPLVEQYKLVETNFNVAPVYMNQYSAPTIDVTQRWLREVKEMYAEAYLSESHHTAVWIAEVYLWENRPLGRELRDKCLCTGIGPIYFDTYEEALEAGIKKALGIILEKGK